MDTMERETRSGEQPEAAHAVLAPPSPPPPPSSTSSPSHEFSFTISLHPFSNSTPPLKLCNKQSPPPPSAAFDIDLAPADDIFLHGHLLPLHLLSISPRPSDISIEDLTLPLNPSDPPLPATNPKGRKNPKSLSSFFGFKKRREESEDDKKKTKKGMDIAGMLKKYASMMLSFRGRKEKDDLRRRPYSLSGNLNPRGGREGWQRPRRWSSGGGLSVPTSKRTSPANSGLLFASPTTAVSSSSDGSTMEELQNAIQAAIAHCKSSTVGTKEDKCQF